MHSALAIRLDWVLEHCLPPAGVDGLPPKLLDIGRYESYFPRRNQLLENGRVDYHMLPDANHGFSERVAKTLFSWPDLADDSFDAILSTHALSHVRTPWLAFAEMFRVLRPGGKIIIIEPGITDVVRRHHADNGVPIPTTHIESYRRHKYLPDNYRFSDAAISAMAQMAGFAIHHSSLNAAPQNPEAAWFSCSEVILLGEKSAPGESAEKPRAIDNPLPTTFRKYLDSRETASALVPAVTPPILLSKKRSRTCKLSVVGPCNAKNISVYLNNALPDYSVEFIEATFRGTSDSSHLFHTESREYEDSDIVFVLDTRGLEHVACKGKTIRYPNLRFRGFHPDFQAAAHAELGHLGSSIVAECYLRGLSEQQALGYFKHETFARLGYYGYWDMDTALMRRCFKAVDLDFDGFLASWMRKGVFMHDPDHPKDFVFKEVVDCLCEKHGIPVNRQMGHVHFDFPSHDTIPVYPEIARHLNIPDAGSYCFRIVSPRFPIPWKWEEVLDLAEYIKISYRGYELDGTRLERFVRLEAL